MSKGEWHPGAVAMAALYLAGGPHGPQAPLFAWPSVLAHLRLHVPRLPGLARSLTEAGFWYEGSLIDTPGRLAWAEGALMRGSCVTAACSQYPRGWLGRLGGSAPPALWLSGTLPQGDSVSLVGSRSLSPVQASFASHGGAAIAELGKVLVSGGAVGSDTLGAHGFLRAGCPGRVVLVLPFGLDHTPSWVAQTGATLVSPFAPAAPFLGRQAMARNALIHAMSGHSLVVASQFRTGGTWHGCGEAARRRLSWLAIADWQDRASHGLAALGGTLLDPSCDVLPQIKWVLANKRATADPSLFGDCQVREAPFAYGLARRA